MLCGMCLAAAGVIPVDCVAYDTVWRYLMPLAAACFLLEADVQRLSAEGGPVLAAFTVGAAGMVLGALAGVALLREPLGPQGAKLAACLCASYVGGSINFAAVAMALQLPASSMPAAMAADNLSMAAFLAVLMAVPVRRAAAAAAAASMAPRGRSPEGRPIGIPLPHAHPESPQLATAEASPSAPPPPPPASPPPAVTAESLSLTLAAAAAACAVSQHLAAALDAAPLTLLFMALASAATAMFAQWLRNRLAVGEQRGPVFAGAAQVGSALMMVFFAVIGASAGSLGCLAGSGVLVAFLAVMVGVHWAVMALVGERLLGLPREALLLGSNANIGGPATAAAMAAARGWQQLVQPAMLTGSMGYAVGTAAGLAVARLAGAAA